MLKANNGTYNDGQIESVLKRLRELAQDLSVLPNKPVPHQSEKLLRDTVQLIVDAGGVVRGLEDKVVELQKGQRLVRIKAPGHFQEHVALVIQELNKLSEKPELTHADQASLVETVKLLQSAISMMDNIVYVADWKRLMRSSDEMQEIVKDFELVMQEEFESNGSRSELFHKAFNILVGLKLELNEKESGIEEMRNLIQQREEELRNTREELQVALRGNEAASLEKKLNDTSFPEVLAPDQPAASSGFWVINREWHEWIVGSYDIDIMTSDGRKRYEMMLHGAIIEVANKNQVNKDLKQVVTMLAVVAWDNFMDRPESFEFGPTFCTGTFKLLPEVVEPEEPKEPIFVLPSQWTEKGVYVVNPEWVTWYSKIFPDRVNFAENPLHRNSFRDYLATTIHDHFQWASEDRNPIVIIDWDYIDINGALHFTTPGLNLLQ